MSLSAQHWGFILIWSLLSMAFAKVTPLLAWYDRMWTPCSCCTRWLPRLPIANCGLSQTPSECLSACRPAWMRLSLSQPVTPPQASVRKQDCCRGPVGRKPSNCPESGGAAGWGSSCQKQHQELWQHLHPMYLSPAFKWILQSFSVWIPSSSMLFSRTWWSKMAMWTVNT